MKTIFQKGRTSFLFVMLFTAILLLFFLVSLVKPARAVSEKENRALQQRPDFSFSALFEGTYISEVEAFYSDQFPGRDFFLNVNSKIKKITSQFGGKSDTVIYNSDSTDFGGQALSDATDAESADSD